MVKVPKRKKYDTFLFAGEGSYFFENPKMLKIQGRSRDLAFKYGGLDPSRLANGIELVCRI